VRLMPDDTGLIRMAVIAGSTATGKSEVAVKVAGALGGEIVNADSVQLYRHFDIGSAKPSPEMLAAVPHHLVDFLPPDRNFSLWDFKIAAHEAITEIASRGKVPILCGGTGLYLKAVLENLHGGVKGDEGFRRELMGTPAPELYGRLKELDPHRAGEIHPNDTYRIIRGIENACLPRVEPLRELPPYDAVFFILTASRSIIYERVEKRVDTMFENGWIAEVEGILAKGFSSGCKPFNSVGYAQIVRHLAGGMTKEELVAEVKKVTRNYAKRQETWFSAVKDAVRIDVSSGDTGVAAREIIRRMGMTR